MRPGTSVQRPPRQGAKWVPQMQHTGDECAGLVRY
jgi:hypothetical protein